MQLNKKVSMGVAFASKKSYEYEGKKFEADIKDGDIVTILTAGESMIGSAQYGSKEQIVFKITTRNGEKALPFNQTSLNNLIEAFGGDTENWVGKEAKIWIDKVMGQDGYKFHAFVGATNTIRDEESGLFSNPSNTESQVGGYDDLEIIDFSEDELPIINHEDDK